MGLISGPSRPIDQMKRKNLHSILGRGIDGGSTKTSNQKLIHQKMIRQKMIHHGPLAGGAPPPQTPPNQTFRWVVRTNFCVPLGPRAAGGGPSGTQKLIKQKFLMRVFCPHGPLRKYFRSVFSACTDHYEKIFEAKTFRNHALDA